jgi:hypothetical protein
VRIRTIKPEFWTHPILSRLSHEARLAAIGLLNIADDDGFFLADAALIRSALWPFDEDSTNARRALDALSKAGYIEIRESSTHGPIGSVLNFSKHQRIDRPTASKLAGYFNSSNPRRVLDESSLLEGKGKEQGKEGIREQESNAPHTIGAGNSNTGPIDPPNGMPGTDQEATQAAATVGCPGEFATDEWHRANGRGWVDSRGVQIRNWPSYLRSCWTSAQSRQAENAARNGKPVAGERREIREAIPLKMV